MKLARWLAPLVVTALISAGTAHAAKEFGLGATYDPRLPIGSFRDFAPNVAFGGLQVKFDYYPFDALSIGLEAQYQLFQRGVETETVPIANGALTAPSFHYASFWSFIPTARYYVGSGAIRPYAALGVGLQISTFAVLVSDLPQRDVTAALILQPSVGVLWRLSPPPAYEERPAGYTRKPLESLYGITASLAYAFTTADVAGASNVSYVGIQLGVYAKP